MQTSYRQHLQHISKHPSDTVLLPQPNDTMADTTITVVTIPSAMIHNINPQQQLTLESLPNEIKSRIFEDLPLLDRINMALTAKRYASLLQTEGLLSVQTSDLNILSTFHPEFRLLRIASPSCWIGDDALDTHAARFEQEQDTMKRIIPNIHDPQDMYSTEWEDRVASMVQKIGGLCTFGLLKCIRIRALSMYASGINGYWWHGDASTEDPENFDFSVERAWWITGLPWGDREWDEKHGNERLPVWRFSEIDNILRV